MMFTPRSANTWQILASDPGRFSMRMVNSFVIGMWRPPRMSWRRRAPPNRKARSFNAFGPRILRPGFGRCKDWSREQGGQRAGGLLHPEGLGVYSAYSN